MEIHMTEGTRIPKKEDSVLPIFFLISMLLLFLLNISTVYEVTLMWKDKRVCEYMENFYNESFLGEEVFIELNSAFSTLIHKRELNEIVKLYNNHLTDLAEEIPEETIALWAENVSEFQTYLHEQGIAFSFILAPHKLESDTDGMLPVGYETYSNRNFDRLVEGFQENRVTYLDLRELFKEETVNRYDFFFQTDHHWTVYGGFWAHQQVSNEIDKNTGIAFANSDFFQLENYKLTQFEDFWSGSHGRRTGIIFSGLDGLPILTPNFDTDIRVEMPKIQWDRRGDFATAFLNEERLDVNPYGIYLTSDHLTRITNYNVENTHSIFIIKDSFSLVMVPFLALHYQNIYLYDLRLEGSSPAHLLETIETESPDIVLGFYSPHMMHADYPFVFMPNQKDSPS